LPLLPPAPLPLLLPPLPLLLPRAGHGRSSQRFAVSGEMLQLYELPRLASYYTQLLPCVNRFACDYFVSAQSRSHLCGDSLPAAVPVRKRFPDPTRLPPHQSSDP